MSKSRKKLFDDTCWVYVQQDDNGAYVIAITYNEEFRQQESCAGRAPLLWRKFDDTFSAAGYRIILKNLPTISLQKVLKEYNDSEEEKDC